MATSECTHNETPDLTESSENVNTCLFCSIANGQTDTEILLCDDELVCFRDVKPGARHHYLVVPREHIVNCTSLGEEHIPLVEKMEGMGRSALLRSTVTDLDDVRLGFHMPVFSSVPHLHLHVIAPASQMGIRSLLQYGPQSYWFITVSGGRDGHRSHSHSTGGTFEPYSPTSLLANGVGPQSLLVDKVLQQLRTQSHVK